MQPSPRGKGDVPPDSFDPCRSTCLPDLTVYIVLLEDVFVIRWLKVSTMIKAGLGDSYGVACDVSTNFVSRDVSVLP